MRLAAVGEGRKEDRGVRGGGKRGRVGVEEEKGRGRTKAGSAAEGRRQGRGPRAPESPPSG